MAFGFVYSMCKLICEANCITEASKHRIRKHLYCFSLNNKKCLYYELYIIVNIIHAFRVVYQFYNDLLLKNLTVLSDLIV